VVVATLPAARIAALSECIINFTKTSKLSQIQRRAKTERL
jgi:hypothetical protein